MSMSTYAQKKTKKRTIILSFFLFVWTGGLCLRLIQFQVFEHPLLRAQVLAQAD